MTAATPALPAKARAGHVENQTWLTARWLLRTQVYLAAWFWGLAIVVVAAVIVIVVNVGDLHNSIVAFTRQGAIWFPFSVFIIVTTTYFPIHVATGLTRRSLVRGSLVAAAATAVLYGGMFSLLLLVERAVFDAAGWQWKFFDDLSAGAGPETFIPAALLTYLVAYVSGLLVGIVYLRTGGWWGTLLLPFTAGPILIVSAFFAADAGPIATESWFGGNGVTTPVAVAASLVLVAVMAFVVDRLVRTADVLVRTS